MLRKLKELFYFPIASYFRFFAAIRLRRWHPRIIVVTGSNGKTTLFHLLEAQFGKQARHSHHANSSFGIPFNILGLERKTLLKSEWIKLFLLAPLKVFAPLPKEKIFVVECDCDRPGEGKFLAELLKPEVVLWVSTSRTHGMNFEALVTEKRFATVEEAIAYEFGYFLAYCSDFVVIDGDSSLQVQQTNRTKARVKAIKKTEILDKYHVDATGTTFVLNKKSYTFTSLLPEVVATGLAMCIEAVDYFKIDFDPTFAHYTLPPGRGSLFSGIKKTTIIDSCYNANLSSMEAILSMYKQFAAKKKWAVIGDMLEQGAGEREQHEKLAVVLSKVDLDRIVFLGPRVRRYTYPYLQQLDRQKISMDAFDSPREALDFLQSHIEGGETILFKGARFMEGIIEHLLANPKDAAKLARREKVWEIRRKKWGL
ncbi:MAG: cyanophycin synthetase [Patescibacteria group bacterium]|mgnify:CR=1 FL=1